MVFTDPRLKSKVTLDTVAYLGFHKGVKFSLDTNVHTKKGPIFSYFFPMGKTDFFTKGPWPPKYATVGILIF